MQSFDGVMQPIRADSNLLALLNEIRKRGPLQKSKAGLDLPVSKPTRYALMQELVDRGFFNEKVTSEKGKHRRSSVIRVVQDRYYSLGIDIHMDGVGVVLLDIDRTIKSRVFLPNDVDREKGVATDGRDAILDRIQHGIEQVMRDSNARTDQIVSTGVSDSGIVDARDRISILNRYIPDWAEVPIGSILSRLVPAPTYLVQDASLIALAEIQTLGLQALPHVLCIALRHGVGLGAFIHGRLYTGQTGNAGEWSVMDVFHAERSGKTQQQDLDTLLGIPALAALCARLPAGGEPDGCRPDDSKCDDDVVQSVFWAYENDRPEILDGMNRYVQLLGAHLANLVYIFDIGHLIIAGRFAFCGERFRTTLLQQVRKHLRSHQEVHILRGTLGVDAAALGAAYMAQESVFNPHGEILP